MECWSLSLVFNAVSYFKLLAIFVESHGLGVERTSKSRNRHCSALKNVCSRRWLLSSAKRWAVVWQRLISQMQKWRSKQRDLAKGPPSKRQRCRTSRTQLSGTSRSCYLQWSQMIVYYPGVWRRPLWRLHSKGLITGSAGVETVITSLHKLMAWSSSWKPQSPLCCFLAWRRLCRLRFGYKLSHQPLSGNILIKIST